MGEVLTAQEAIKRAAPFINGNPHRPTSKWSPEELLQIGWAVIATGPSRNAVQAADTYVQDMLEEARNRWIAGFYADPFAEPAHPRIPPVLP